MSATPTRMVEADWQPLRDQGFSDEALLLRPAGLHTRITRILATRTVARSLVTLGVDECHDHRRGHPMGVSNHVQGHARGACPLTPSRTMAYSHDVSIQSYTTCA